jgi:hypothetical protein
MWNGIPEYIYPKWIRIYSEDKKEMLATSATPSPMKPILPMLGSNTDEEAVHLEVEYDLKHLKKVIKDSRRSRVIEWKECDLTKFQIPKKKSGTNSKPPLQ